MTDKQIIIDDQKKTIHRLQDECTEKTNAIIALGNKLTAKEQECERWKSNFNGKVSAIEELLKQLDQLKAENEELKKQIDDLLHKPEIQNKILWKIDNEKLLLSKDTYIYKLEKTLTEIKEIAEDESYIGFWDEQISKILQKISEVEDVRN